MYSKLSHVFMYKKNPNLLRERSGKMKIYSPRKIIFPEGNARMFIQ